MEDAVQRRLFIRSIGLLVFVLWTVSSRPESMVNLQPAQLISGLEKGAPFSFTYAGKSSSEFLASWQKSENVRSISGGRIVHTAHYLDPVTHLEVTREITRFPGTGAIDWVLIFRNGGTHDSQLLEKVLPLDLDLPVSSGAAVTFHHAHGSTATALDYTPVDTLLSPGKNLTIAHYIMVNGVQKDSYLPFFNLQWPEGGLVAAIGWTGQWTASATRAAGSVALRSGQELTHLKLHPGESIRTPRILLVPWNGKDRIVGQNALRRLLVLYYTPRVEGRPPMPPVASTGAYALIFDGIAKKTGQNPLDILPTITQRDLGGPGGRGFPGPGDALNYVTEKNQLKLINDLPAIGIEAYWLDAGWMEGLWPSGRGSWAPNKEFPDGLRELGEAAHKKGLKFLLWFDPEGVSPGSLIAKEHPEWVLHQPREGKWGGIFKFSDPAAQRWMTDLMADRIRMWQVDIFRMDRNTNPLPFWRAADTPDRQGITEIRQIEGLYALWDGLLDRFPRLMIDNANWRVTGPDIEAMRRTIGSLTRSEITNGGIPDPVADQAQTAELSMWIPFDANILNGADFYNFRSTATSGVGIGLDLESPYIPVDTLRKEIAELKALRPFWLGDYYPLMPINENQDSWCGWQFNRRDLGAGFAMLFRRPKSNLPSYDVSLQGLDPAASYEVTFTNPYDNPPKHTMSGRELAHLHVDIREVPGSLLVRYQKARPDHMMQDH
jgi:alpha-galactosidase